MSATQDLVNRYHKGISLMEDALLGVSPEALDRVPAPGKWTIRQIVIHVADAEIILASRIRAVAGDPGSRLLAFDQDKWAANMPYEKLPVEPAMAVIRALRESTTALLRALPESAWSRTGIHEQRGELSVRDLVDLAANHGENHARQIREHCVRFAAVA
jgi:hypothetical protein